MEKQIENILIKVDEGTMPVQQALMMIEAQSSKFARHPA